jgi:aspartate/methionine/tyrosine aminotransferase
MRIPQRVRDIELPQFDLLNDVAATWRARGADVISLGQALPGFEPPRAALEALRDALADRATHVYSGDAGVPELRRALSAWLAPLGANIDPDREVIISAGATQAFQLALTTLVDPGDEVILPSPYFLNHDMAVRSVAAIPIEAPTAAARSFAPTWRDIVSHVSPRTAAVVIVSPSNPTGAVVDPAEFGCIVGECASRDIAVFVDETYLRFTYESAPATAAALPRWRDNVVVIGSFSKAFAITGWRCGYLLANAEVTAEAMKIQDCMIICAPVPVQRAIASVLERDPDYPRQWLPELRARRDLLVNELRAISGVTPVVPAGGFFVMARVEGMTDSRASARRLVETAQVVTIPGAFFGRAGEGHLRISYGAVPQERLREACARIAEFLAGSRPTDASDTVQVS